MARKIKNLILVNSLREFKANWDGYNAPGFTQELCDFVACIIENLDETIQPKFVFPTGRGSIQLEYEKENDDYLEFEIYSLQQIEMFRVLENCVEIEKTIELDELTDVIKDFIKV